MGDSLEDYLLLYLKKLPRQTIIKNQLPRYRGPRRSYFSRGIENNKNIIFFIVGENAIGLSLYSNM